MKRKKHEKRLAKARSQRQFWGIDTEASNTGAEHTEYDIHTVQVCSSRGEETGRVFWNADEFKEWLGHKHSRPKILYAFTLPFEYGTLAAWELLNASDEKGQYPWQQWADAPINLFYIHIGRAKIAVYDTRIFFYQLRYGNNYLTNLRAVGDYLSEYYKKDIRKLKTPLGEDFGKRPPTDGERPYFERYGIRDAYISAMAAKWIHENIIDKWLESEVPIQKLYSWGTVAKYYFALPKINKIIRYGKKIIIKFPNQWHQQIFNKTFAGRSEAFHTGNVGEAYYNDVSSLYPTSIIQTQCMLITNVKQWHGDFDDLIGHKATWQKFYEVTGVPYGWVLGTFTTHDDLWGIPVKVGWNNWYVTGSVPHSLYHILDLEASNATIDDCKAILVPIFDYGNNRLMEKFEELARIKLLKQYESQIVKFCIKNTTNSTSGILGKSHPNFGDTTNIPAYNTLLAQSHLDMSRIFHKYHSKQHPIVYTDTDSFFWHKPVEEIIEDCVPYPTLPFQVFETVPLEVGVRGTSRPEGTVIFRGKMYYQNENSMAFSGWKPFPRFFIQIIQNKPHKIDIERQVSRKWRTRDRYVTSLKIGRWHIKRETWNIKKLKEIFRADTKRKRPTQDSYQLFLDDAKASSRAWTYTESIEILEKIPWDVALTAELLVDSIAEVAENSAEKDGWNVVL